MTEKPEKLKDMEDIDDNDAIRKKIIAKIKGIVDVTPTLNEENNTTAIVSFGRFNPITIGHEKLIEKLISESRSRNAIPLLYLSHTQDSKKNPLTYKEKILLAEKVFGRKVVVRSKARTIIEVLKEVNEKFANVIMIVGSDRIAEFERLLNSANGKDFNFITFEVISAGKRDPDSSDKVQAASASKAREFVINDDFESFKKILPKALSSDATSIFKIIQERLGVNVATNEATLTIAQRRKRAIIFRRNRAKIKAGRRRARNRIASTDVIKRRARAIARRQIRKKLSGGSINNLSFSQKVQLDKRLENKKSQIDRLAKRLEKDVRKADRDKRRGVSEEILDERHHKLYGTDGKIMLDRRFKIFRHLRKVDVDKCADLKTEPVKPVKDIEISQNANDKNSNQEPEETLLKDVEFSERVLRQDITESEKFEEIALEALRRLVIANGDKESLEGLAFDVTREFNGLKLSPRELANKFRQRFPDSEIEKAKKKSINKKNEPVESIILNILSGLIHQTSNRK